MCAGEELNLHALRRYHLKVVRLPFRHPRIMIVILNYSYSPRQAGRGPVIFEMELGRHFLGDLLSRYVTQII